MELTPDLLLEAKFSPARRGYDMAEVDDFLERCAEGLDVLLARLKSEFDRAERAEAALMRAETATREADETVIAPDAAEKPEPAAEVVEPKAPVVDVDEPLRVLVMAERTAEATVSEARAEAERIRSEAESVANRQRSEAERLLTTARNDAEAEARKAGEAARREIQGEVNKLRGNRDELATDVRALQRWLDEQRGRMRTTARDLQRLVDDPTALGELAPPITDADEKAEGGRGAAGGDAGAPPTATTAEGDSVGDPTQAVPIADLMADENAPDRSSED